MGIREGNWISWYKTGIMDEAGSYKNDKTNGKWVYYYETGAVKTKLKYKEGRLSGKTKNYYMDGKLQSVTKNKVFKEKEYMLTKSNGEKVYKTRLTSKPHGKWVYYSPDGTVLTELKYKKGVRL